MDQCNRVSEPEKLTLRDMTPQLRIGTRESPLAIWQSTLVKQLLFRNGILSQLVPIHSEGDADTTTPLYEMGVQGIFTKTLDIALLNGEIDIAVHSMKDVPVVLARGLRQAAVLERGPWQDILVFRKDAAFLKEGSAAVIATSSIRRRAQWLHKYPSHTLTTLRGNVNTRLNKLNENPWDGAIFAAAGLERINLRPANSIDLHWMVPAPAQGAIIVVCREDDKASFQYTNPRNHAATDLCTFIERDFLKTLHGGCSSPVSALAVIEDEKVNFTGNITSPDGRYSETLQLTSPLHLAQTTGREAADQLLRSGKAWIQET